MTAKKVAPRDANRRIMFEEAGKGVYLLLRNSGIRYLQGYYDKDHLLVVERAFLTMDVPVVDRLLEVMVWKGEAEFKLTLDELDDVPLQTVINKLRDAWSLSLNGRLYMEQVEFIREEARKLVDGSPLSTSPGDGSAPSSGQASEQDSSLTNSTL